MGAVLIIGYIIFSSIVLYLAYLLIPDDETKQSREFAQDLESITTELLRKIDSQQKLIDGKNEPSDTHSPNIVGKITDHLNWVSSTVNTLNNTNSLVDLLGTCEINAVRYSDLLSCVEWKFKRLSVLIRDKCRCQDCSVQNFSNHVHHLHYIKDQLPWEIENSALVTLCSQCHSNRHNNETIRVYKLNYGRLEATTIESSYCDRCGGSGHLPQFNHVQGGICFKCMGDCVNKSIFSVALKRVKNNINSYDIGSKRSEYNNYINSISIDVFNQLPQLAQNNVADRPNNVPDDDLPF